MINLNVIIEITATLYKPQFNCKTYKYYNSKWQKRNENEERKSRMMPKPNLKAIEDCVEFIRISGGIIKKLDALLKG